MSDQLIDVEGIGASYATTLAGLGLTTTDDLLARGARPAGRAALAEASGIAPGLILEWVNHVDLFRIRGVAGQFADLLEEAGVDTVVELSRRNPDNLVAALVDANAAKNLANRNPSATEVEDWVSQAKTLPRAVYYDDSDAAAAAPTPAPATSALAPTAAAAPMSAPSPAPAPAPRPAASPAATVPTTDERSWLTKLIDRIRGR